MNKRLFLIISGKVQGVLFRAYVFEKANLLGLTGWVRNNTNGTVEVLAEGEERKLLSLREFCKHGPLAAEVKEVKLEWDNYKKEFKRFNVQH